MKKMQLLYNLLFIIALCLIITGLSNPIHREILWLGILIFIVTLVVLGLLKLRASSNKNKTIEKLKETGEKIEVPLVDCEVLENNYSSTIELPDRISLYKSGNELEKEYQTNEEDWDSGGGHSFYRNNKVVDINQSVLKYKYFNGDKEEVFYSQVIPKTKEDLKFKIYFAVTTYIYVNKLNRGEYYFDIDFTN